MLGWLQSNATENGDENYTYSLTVNGVNILQSVPVNLYPLTWNDTADNGIGTMDFTVHDPDPNWSNRNQLLKIGAEVVFFDHANASRLFAGNITHLSYTKAVVGRWVSVTVSSYDVWLDWCIVPRLRMRTNTGKRIRSTTRDQSLVRKLLKVSRSPVRGGIVTNTATDLPVMQLAGNTLREALEEVADAAKKADGGLSVARHFYVDYNLRLHWYEGNESNGAPYRVTDQDYAALVAGHQDNVAYWPLGEDQNNLAPGEYSDRKGGCPLAAWNGFAQSASSLVPNQPFGAQIGDPSNWVGSSSASRLDNIQGLAGGWMFEGWFQLSDLTGSQYLVNTYKASGQNGPDIYIDSSGRMVLRSTADSLQSFTNTGAIVAGNTYHVAMGQRSDGTNKLWLNGVATTLTTDNATLCGDEFTSWVISDSNGPNAGALFHHYAWYIGDNYSDTDAAEHYKAGLGVLVEDHFYEDDGEEDTFWVYVRGKNAKGSGWVTDKASDYVVGNSSSGPSGPQRFIRKNQSDTAKKKNRFGEAAMRRNRRVNSGGFTLQDNTDGWRAGQRVTIHDDAFGFDHQTFTIASVSGTYDGRTQPTITVEYGAQRRKLLKAFWRNLAGKVGK